MSEWLLARTWADFRLRWRQSLALHLALQLLGFAIFAPLVTWVVRRIVLASGEPMISNFDIAAFVLSPAGVVFVLVVAALGIGLLLAEFAGQSWISGHAIARRPVTLASTIAFVLRRLPALIVLSTRMFLRLLLLALPFLAGAAFIWFVMLGGHDINYYLAEHPPEWRRAILLAVVLGAGFGLLAAWQLARWLYAVPILVFEDVTPAQALETSARMTRGRLTRIVPPLALWWLLLAAATVAITWVCRQVSDAGLDWAGIDFRRVLPLVALYLVVTLVGGFLSGGLLLGGHQFLVTRMYAEQSDAATMASARNARDQRRTFTADCAACPPGHAGVSRACLRCRVVHGFTARPGARRGDHCASRRLDRGTREHAGRIPRGDGRRSDLLRAGRAAHSRRPDRGAARR